MKRITRVALVMLILIPLQQSRAGAEQSIQGGYSTKPLGRPIFEPARVAVESVALNNWLNVNYSSLDAESMKGPREHLYYLIDSWVKSIYARDRVVYPKSHDALLENLFSWSERLGVFGGHLIYNALRSDQSPEMPALMQVPSTFSLTLREDMLVVSSKNGHWSVSVPYHFMIWNITAWNAKDGPRTQLLSFSTGATAHKGQDGHSQATLMLMFGPGADTTSFTKYWSTQLGFNGSETAEAIPVRSLATRQRYDKSLNMYSEYASWSSDHGVFVVAYLGINGTYQWNRPHYFDFLSAIQTR